MPYPHATTLALRSIACLLWIALAACDETADGSRMDAVGGSGGAGGSSGSGHGGQGGSSGALADASMPGTDAALGGSGGDASMQDSAAHDGSASCTTLQTWTLASAANAPIDLLWIVSATNTDPMRARRLDLTDAFAAFHQDLRARVPGLRAIVVSSATWPGNAGFPYESSDRLVTSSTDGASLFQELLVQFDAYADALTAGARLHVIGIADEESTYRGDTPTARALAFRDDLTALFEAEVGSAPEWVFHAVASDGAAGEEGCALVEDCCDGLHDSDPACTTLTFFCGTMASPAVFTENGPTYFAQAQDTGGIAASICEPDFAQALAPIADAIALEAAGCRYALSADALSAAREGGSVRAGSETLSQVASEAQCSGDASFYVQDAQSDALVLCPAACSRLQGMALELTHPCAAN